MSYKPGALVFGNVSIWPPVLCAPLAGYTDAVYRKILRESGCPFCYTEMVSAKGLVMGGKASASILKRSFQDRPLAVQLFGKEPGIMAKACSMLTSSDDVPFDAIDINMGCPAKKIVSQGSGSALTEKPDLAYAIVSKMRSVATLPITVKMRLANGGRKSTLEMAKAVCDAGASMIVVHGRTCAQGYGGFADWETIDFIAANVSVPVVGNGDIVSPQDCMTHLRETHCSGIMVGRGIIGNPFFFRELNYYLKNGEYPPYPSFTERMETAKEHFLRALDRYGQRKGLLGMRKHLAYYMKGMPGASKLRRRINELDSPDEVIKLLETGWRQPS